MRFKLQEMPVRFIKSLFRTDTDSFQSPSLGTKIERDVSFTLTNLLTLDTHSVTLHLAGTDGADREACESRTLTEERLSGHDFNAHILMIRFMKIKWPNRGCMYY